MENWVILILVLGSNAIMGAVNWFVTRAQLKHSDHQLGKQMQAQREADKRERKREVRSEPLLKLRAELAHMAAKGERVASLATPPFYESKEDIEEFREALDDWKNYMASGEFQKVLFMQYDFVLVGKVDAIRHKYNLARYRFGEYWQWSSDADKQKGLGEAMNLIVSNRSEIAKVQSEVSKLLEEL